MNGMSSGGPDISVALGNASTWTGPRPDMVFTHPYAPIPKALHGLPSFINLYHPPGAPKRLRIIIAQDWIGGAELHPLSDWGLGLNNTLYVANLPVRRLDLQDLIEDPFEPNIGWFPVALPLRAISAYRELAEHGVVVWDGFCGRGTVGKACQRLGLGYIGIDKDPSRVELARKYLNLLNPETPL